MQTIKIALITSACGFLTQTALTMDLDKAALKKMMPRRSMTSYLSTKNKPKAQTITSENVVKARSITTRLARQGNKYYACKKGKLKRIPNCNVDKNLLKLRGQKLKSYFKNGGYIEMNRRGNNYGLDSRMRVKGGTPVAGAAAYWITKGLCYGGMWAATTFGLSKLFGKKGTSGCVNDAAKYGMKHYGSRYVLDGPPKMGNAFIAGDSIVRNYELQDEVVMAGIAASASSVGVFGAVEAAAAYVGAFFTALPFP